MLDGDRVFLWRGLDPFTVNPISEAIRTSSILGSGQRNGVALSKQQNRPTSLLYQLHSRKIEGYVVDGPLDSLNVALARASTLLSAVF